jgi:hypothetical protein
MSAEELQAALAVLLTGSGRPDERMLDGFRLTDAERDVLRDLDGRMLAVSRHSVRGKRGTFLASGLPETVRVLREARADRVVAEFLELSIPATATDRPDRGLAEALRFREFLRSRGPHGLPPFLGSLVEYEAIRRELLSGPAGEYGSAGVETLPPRLRLAGHVRLTRLDYDIPRWLAAAQPGEPARCPAQFAAHRTRNPPDVVWHRLGSAMFGMLDSLREPRATGSVLAAAGGDRARAALASAFGQGLVIAA